MGWRGRPGAVCGWEPRAGSCRGWQQGWPDLGGGGWRLRAQRAPCVSVRRSGGSRPCSLWALCPPTVERGGTTLSSSAHCPLPSTVHHVSLQQTLTPQTARSPCRRAEGHPEGPVLWSPPVTPARPGDRCMTPFRRDRQQRPERPRNLQCDSAPRPEPGLPPQAEA